MNLTPFLFVWTWIAAATGLSMMYGNNATAGTSFLPSSGKKVWVDSDAMLTRGTLEKYFVYVHNVTTGLLPYIRLQIWTPVENDIEIRYRLKWEKEVMLTQAGRLYEFELRQSEKIEITEYDLIGFCSEENVTPVSMTFADHRTHFRFIENDEFPVVWREYGFEPIPLPVAFSIAVSISDDAATNVSPTPEMMTETHNTNDYSTVVKDDTLPDTTATAETSTTSAPETTTTVITLIREVPMQGKTPTSTTTTLRNLSTTTAATSQDAASATRRTTNANTPEASNTSEFSAVNRQHTAPYTTPTPATSGSTPATSGSTPATSGSTPATSGSTPATSGSTPATSGSTPATSVSTPATSNFNLFAMQGTATDTMLTANIDTLNATTINNINNNNNTTNDNNTNTISAAATRGPTLGAVFLATIVSFMILERY